ARKRVISALVYPAVLVLLSIAMIAVMAIYVVPKFEVFFSDLEVDLPLPTRIRVDSWRLKLPLLGGVFHRFALSEFCRALSTLLTGGIPLVPALEIANAS